MYSKQQFFLVFLGLFVICADWTFAVPKKTGSSILGSQGKQSKHIQSVQKGVTFLAEKLNKLFFNEVKEKENVLISPLSIYATLASLHLGADGETKEELSKVLGLPSNNKQLLEAHHEFGNLLKSLQSVPEFNEIRFGNEVFLQKGKQFKPSYVQQAKSYYDNEASTVDFKNGGNSSTDTVNHWVLQKTKGRISKLFDQLIDRDTTLLLATTLYFNGNWNEKFFAHLTETEKFNTGSGEVDVQMMNQKESYLYSKNDRLQIQSLSLPYRGFEYSMIIVLPNANQSLKDLVNKLTAEDYQQIIKNTTESIFVEVKIPRMKFKWQKSINEQLKQLGLNSVFQKANLGNMVLNQNTAVSDVMHATEIEVHENGTVATLAIPRKSVLIYIKRTLLPIEFYVNRPFLFLIYSRAWNLILFSGLAQNPNDAVH